MKPGARKHDLRFKRHRHIRKRVIGTPQRPRLCVFRSNRHIYIQVVDDYSGRTLASASTLSPQLRGRISNGATVEAAAMAGEMIAGECLSSGISKVVFDRGGFKFHGRVKAVAQAVRKRFADANAEGF